MEKNKKNEIIKLRKSHMYIYIYTPITYYYIPSIYNL